MHACVYEDRPSDLVAVKVLLASLRDHTPGLTLDVTLPNATAQECDEIARRFDATVSNDSGGVGAKYDVKPGLLRRALERGADEAIWIDSDIVAARDFRPTLADVPPNAIVVAEETLGVPYQGGTSRTVGVGLSPGRSLHATANTCVTRVTRAHLPLLGAWEALLRTPEYRAAQQQPLADRPVWYKGDQDLLTALLGSAEFSDIPIHWLRRGRDVAHCFQLGGVGYNVLERLANSAARAEPIFAHSCGDRPWRPPHGNTTLHLETSPYTLVAARYADVVGEPLDWTQPSLTGSRVLRAVFRDGVNMAGFFPALARELWDQRLLKTAVRPLLRPGR